MACSHCHLSLSAGRSRCFGTNVQASLRSLSQWTIDVDLLMILAALGAAAVEAPFEGAMLLFLFSLSNVLQAYAIDRTRKAIPALSKTSGQRHTSNTAGQEPNFDH
jgi:Cd2+/Zn2+-exporting ATPase